MHNKNCRVCGLLLTEEPWGIDGSTPSWEICPCCGTEFGYEDCTSTSAKNKRAMWLASGAIWFNESEKPNNWSLEEQMAGVPFEYR